MQRRLDLRANAPFSIILKIAMTCLSFVSWYVLLANLSYYWNVRNFPYGDKANQSVDDNG